MSEGLNRVMLIGNLGSDPELRFTQGGSAVLNIRLATNESYLDKDKVRQERTEWHDVVVWGKRAEALAKILDKGSSIFVEGSLRTSSFDDREGNKRYRTQVVASNILLSGRGNGKRAGSYGGPGDAPAPRSGPDDLGGGFGAGAASPEDDLPFITSTPNAWGL